MKVLVGCECSGVVREAFRKRGHDAYSCDIIPSDDNSPYHIQDDITNILTQGWDLLIGHPPCTYLCTSGNRWMNNPDRQEKRKQAVEFFKMLAEAPIEKICLENPVGVLSTLYKKPTQIIQMWQFGHEEAKKTCLWLKGLPNLKPTKIVTPTYVTLSSGKKLPKWYSNASVKNRAKIRSKTFQGFADAMAEQWGVI